MKLYGSPRKDTIPNRKLLPNSPFLELLQSGGPLLHGEQDIPSFAQKDVFKLLKIVDTGCLARSSYVIVYLYTSSYIIHHTSHIIHHTSYIVLSPMQSHWIMFHHIQSYSIICRSHLCTKSNIQNIHKSPHHSISFCIHQWSNHPPART